MEKYLTKLGLSGTPDLKAIKKAYAAKLKSIDQSNIREFQEVREAYLVLCGKSAPEVSDAEAPNINSKDTFNYAEAELRPQEELKKTYLSDLFGLIDTLFLENENPDFRAAEWINSQSALDGLQARTEFSKILLEDFLARTRPWSSKIMREISIALNWHEISSGPCNPRMLVEFEFLLARIDYHHQVISTIEEFFNFPWKDQESAYLTLLSMRDEINYDLNLLSEFFLNKTIQCCGSAPIASLVASQFFAWKGLDYAQERSLENALTEAKFREKVLLVKNYQKPPSDDEGYALWHLMQPIEYRAAINYLASNSIDSVISVIRKIDVYNLKSELNGDQINFYSEYDRMGSAHPARRMVLRKKHYQKILTTIGLIACALVYFFAKYLAEPLSKLIGS